MFGVQIIVDTLPLCVILTLSKRNAIGITIDHSEYDMKSETFVTASTKVNNVSHKSNVTINWDGMTVDDLQALAQRAIVIRKQNADRTAGVVPEASYMIKATDYKIGVRIGKPQLSAEQMLAALSEEDRAALIAKFLTGAVSA